MARPRKNPSDPKWIETPEIATQEKPDEWKRYFAAAMTGLIARGGLSSEQIVRTASQYADEAIAFTQK